MSKQLDYITDTYEINIANVRELRGHSINYVSEPAANLNILAKVFCTNGAEYSSVILPHGDQELPIYVSHPYGYPNSPNKKIFLTDPEIREISKKLKAVLSDVNNQENKQSLLRSLVRCQNPFIEKLISQEIELVKKKLKEKKILKLETITSQKEGEEIEKLYKNEIKKLEDLSPYWDHYSRKRETKQWEDFITDHCATIFPKFLNDQDLRDISQYRDRQFLKVLEPISKGQSLYQGVHVEAQGVDFAHKKHKQETNEFSIGLAKKDGKPEIGCCAGCALEFKILSLRERDKIIVHRSADFPINMPTSQAYKPSELMRSEERKLFDRIIPPRELFQGSMIINEEQNIRMQRILSDKITTIQQLESKIDEFTQQTQNSKGKRQKLKQKLGTKTSELEASQKGNAELSQKLGTSEEKLKEKDQELNQSKETITELSTKLEASKQEETRLVTECTSLKQDFETKEKELNQSKEENKGLSEKIKISTKENQELILQFKDSQQKLKAKTSELNLSQQRSSKLIEEIQAVQKQNKTLEEKLIAANQELTSKTSELKQTTEANTSLIEQIQGANKEKNNLATKLIALEQALEAKDKALETSKEQNADITKENDMLKNQLEILQQELKKKNEQLEKSQQYGNVNTPSTIATNIEAQNLPRESSPVASNLGQHSPPPRSPEQQPEVKKQKVEEVKSNLGTITQAKQIGQEIADVSLLPSSNSPESVPKAPGKRPESPPRAP